MKYAQHLLKSQFNSSQLTKAFTCMVIIVEYNKNHTISRFSTRAFSSNFGKRPLAKIGKK